MPGMSFSFAFSFLCDGEQTLTMNCSSFPILPPGHPQSTIYALAEKISEKILQGS